uniref:ADF-H domain-containing protein n=1 Tax=Panagrolaimus sp. PS1159 TaxID=55785 RepID=A0AC35GY04_9BILA
MSCQSGIRADNELMTFFEDCKRGKYRMGKIVINKEKLVVNYHSQPSNDWKADWKRDLPNCVDSYEPCFILFRLETPHDWILISFADDKASSRDKMVLAATKATFKSDFGQSFIQGEYQISSTHEFNLDTFERKLHKGGVRDNETSAMTSFEQDREIDFVQLSVDTLNEAIKLEGNEERLDASSLNSKVTKQKPRYTLFRLREVEDKPVFFIYSIPPSAGCTIKELMLFSSCKAPFLTEVEHNCGVKIDKKIEVDSRDKLDAESLISYWRPAAIEEKKPFARPPRPGSGPRRITTAAAE